MAKLELNSIANLQSEQSAVQTMNENFDKIEAAMDNTLSRDGTTPNQLEAPLDVNSQRLINLTAPRSGTDAARLVDLQESLTLTDTIVPALEDGKVLGNLDGGLIWIDATEIPGIGDMQSSNNLSELPNIATARTNLGLGTAAVANIGTSGDAVGKLNANVTWSGSNAQTGAFNVSGVLTLSGTVDHKMTSTPTTLSDTSLGYRGAPQNVQAGNYTFVLLDAGKHVTHTSATDHTWTIPPAASVNFPFGSVIILVNFASSTLTISRGVGVSLRIAGSATDADVTIGPYGVASLFYLTTNIWFVSGAGVS